MNVVTRSQWGARAPKNRTALNGATTITIHYEGPQMGDYSHDSCPSKVRGIQAFHMDSRGWADIAYSDIVCRHGYVYEGRGPGVRTAAQGTNEGNNVSLAICAMLGAGDTVPDVLKQAIRERADWYTAEHGVGTIRKGHRQWHSTACPGDTLFAWVEAGMPAPHPAPPPAPPSTPGLPATHEFFAYASTFTGGVDVAGITVGGKAYVVVGAGAGGGPHMRVLNLDGSEIVGIMPFPVAFNGGIWVGAGDFDGDGDDEIAVGAGPGGGPQINLYKFDGTTLTQLAAFMGWGTGAGGWGGGVRPSVVPGVVVAAVGPGGGPHVKVWDKAALGL